MSEVKRRQFLIGAAGAAAATSLVGINPAEAQASVIETENGRAGSTAWRLTNPANDDLSQLGAYARQDSVRVGDRLDLHVNVPSSTSVSAQVFRLGWYGGSRARLMRTLSATTVAGSPALTTNPTTGATNSQAPVAFSFTIPNGWVSGIYLVRFVGGGVDCHATFVVRDSRAVDMVMAQPILTYAAYTNTPRPLGKSLYDGQSGGGQTNRGTQRATEVSLDRPYRNSGSGDLFFWDHDLVSWLEREGYDVSYVTNLDVDRSPATLRRGKVAVISGHDEYWTQSMMNAYLAARNAGVHIANFGANCAYWRVRMTAASDGRAKRTVVCWKYAPGENNNTPTVLFKDTSTTMQGMWGINFMDFADFLAGPYTPIVPIAEDHWFWEGTGVENDQPLPTNIMGYEVDRRNFAETLPSNTEYTFLAASPFTGDEFGFNYAHTVVWRSTSGAWVFSGGTTSWAWGLIRNGFVSAAIQRGTQNLFARMLGTNPPGGNTLPAPTGLRTTFQDRRRVVINYQEVTGATGYEILRDGEVVATDPNGWYTDLGLEPGTTYSYAVRALNAAGQPGTLSAPIDATTRGEGGGGGLPAPANLRTTFQDRRRVVLNYGEVAGAVSYEIFRNDSLVDTDDNGWHTDLDLTPGTTYTYKVRAVAADGTRGAFTPNISATTTGGGGGNQLPAPANLRNTFQDRRRLVLNYGTVSGAANYEILRDGAVIATDDNEWFTNLGLTPGTTYRYQVRAVAADGTRGLLSNAINATTRS